MRRLAPLLLIALVLPGCAVQDPAAPADAPSSWPGEPHPRGDEWPAGLAGPFEALPPERVTITSHDGTSLSGYVWRPKVPEGVRVPVVLVSTPYGVDEAWSDEGSYPRPRLVSEGFAVAAFAVRGTSISGGCFSFHGMPERQDAAVLVERLAAMPWSNGRVGMMGISYMAHTAMAGAVAAPDALKTVVVSGLGGDPYTFYHTPQGAAFAGGARFAGRLVARVAMDREPALDPGAVCTEAAELVAALEKGIHTDDRSPDVWRARHVDADLANVTAAVLLAHGFQDLWGSGHGFQEDAVWAALTNAPRWQLEGQWEHAFPGGGPRSEGTVPDWDDRLVAWLAYWLQGRGGVPAGLGRVDYEDDTNQWHASAAWPPVEARAEALPLAGGGAFEARGSETWPDGIVCGPDEGRGLVFRSEPAAATALVAGNPFALLRLRADAPGGIVSLQLLDLAPDAGCDGDTWKGATPISWGAADLRFHHGEHTGTPFPVGTWTDVRVDLTNLAHVLPAGHRLAVVVGGGDTFRGGQPYHPRVEVDAASHVVVPLVEGTLGGTAPADEYPPRPLVPQALSAAAGSSPAPRSAAASAWTSR